MITDKLKAFIVHYSTAFSEGFSEIVLIENDLETTDLENERTIQKIKIALSEKSLRKYKIDDKYNCKIENIKPISLSMVKMSELSITEYILLNKYLNT